MIDEKYVVFKREDWTKFSDRVRKVMEDDTAMDSGYLRPPSALDDATVIRGQDLFAGPALHTYAACIAMVGNLLVDRDPVEARRLREIGHYFDERAMEADASAVQKLPD